MDHNSKELLLSESVNTQSFKEVYNYENLASKEKKKANFLSTEAVRLYELGSLMTSISHLIKHVAFLKSKPFYLLMHKRLQDTLTKTAAVGRGYLVKIRLSDCSETRMLTIACPSSHPQIQSIFPSLFTSFHPSFPSHLARLSISLLIPIGLEAFLLCLSSLVRIREQTSPLAVII